MKTIMKKAGSSSFKGCLSNRQCLSKSAARHLAAVLVGFFQLIPVTASAAPVAPQRTVISIAADKPVRDALPETFFGFNIRWERFQRDLWDEQKDQVKPRVVKELLPLTGALYRYPGGLVANEFLWEQAALPMAERKKVNAVRYEKNGLPLFGTGEFLDFVKQVNGNLIYTVNIVGEGNPSKSIEYPSKKMAESNRALAAFIKERTPKRSVRYYQLGNELDRNRYQWSHEKYISRSLDTINAIHEVDPDARFIAFLREFNWRYRFGKQGMSNSNEFIRDVLRGLPMVNDYSLHFYYDGEVRAGGSFMHIEDVVKRVNRTLAVAREVRKDTPLRVWITEHSRRLVVNSENEELAKLFTTNLEAALSTADFLVAMAQVPEVEGTSLQALNGVGRQVFDASVKYNDLRPRPVFWAMRVLNEGRKGAVLATHTQGPYNSGYEGGYDIRATALAEGNDKLVLWVVNRAIQEQPVDIRFSAFKGQTLTMQHYYMAGRKGIKAKEAGDNYTLQLEPAKEEISADNAGVIQVNLPPTSVSTYIFRKTPR